MNERILNELSEAKDSVKLVEENLTIVITTLNVLYLLGGDYT